MLELQVLNVSHNQLTRLPASLGCRQNVLSELYLSGNPLVQDYYRLLGEEELIVGKSNVSILFKVLFIKHVTL